MKEIFCSEWAIDPIELEVKVRQRKNGDGEDMDCLINKYIEEQIFQSGIMCKP